MERSVLVTSEPSRVTVHQRQLRIDIGEEHKGQVPLEDLGLLVLESHRTIITTAALDSLVQAGAAVVICDKSHLPSGILAPLAGHVFLAQRLRQQMCAPDAIKRQVWSHIIRTKIAGQRANLALESARRKLATLQRRVRSGDPSNCEAQAAKVYWANIPCPKIEGRFRRNPILPGTNSLLNYGYAIARAAIARSLVASGLHPALGIHHSSRSNLFCLADDVLELYRPFVDRRVLQWVTHHGEEPSAEARAYLVELLAEVISYEGGKGPIAHVISASCSSLARIFEAATTSPSGKSWPRLARELVVPSYEDSE